MPTSNPATQRTTIGDDLHNTAEHLREAAHERADALRERAGEALESGRESVRSHPLASLAIAAGVGVVLGMLISHRRGI
jgi:ElaB/YqjD/DUF883 family membrane-anchored ribosome-binding protein